MWWFLCIILNAYLYLTFKLSGNLRPFIIEALYSWMIDQFILNDAMNIILTSS